MARLSTMADQITAALALIPPLVAPGAIGPAWHVTLRGVRSVLVRRWAGSETADVSIRQGMLIRTPDGPRRDFAANTKRRLRAAGIGDRLIRDALDLEQSRVGDEIHPRRTLDLPETILTDKMPPGQRRPASVSRHGVTTRVIMEGVSR